MKKILILQGGIGISGISKALINLLHSFRGDAEIDLFICNPNGLLREYIPEEVNILSDRKTELLCSGFSGLKCLLKFGLVDFYRSIVRCILSVFSHRLGALYLSKLMPEIHKEYDLIIDWQGQYLLYWMVDKLKAKKKVSVFHSDYHKWPYYFKTDRKYYPKLDKVYSISEKCVLSLKEFFPEISNKVELLENIISPVLIGEMAKETILENDIIENSKNIILSIGHVSFDKGSDLAMRAAEILKDRGISFNWIFIGSIKDKEYAKIAEDRGLSNIIHFWGLKSNPYPYIQNATIIAHLSRFEGKSVALDEAKLLCKPVVVTNFSTVNDQFTDRVNASICEMDPQSIADAIEELLTDSALRKKYSENLLDTRHDNSSEIEKLYAIFDD